MEVYYRPHPGVCVCVCVCNNMHVHVYMYPPPPPTGLYFTGDGAMRDEDGLYRISGRVDDIIMSKGHRIGTAELECAMVSVCMSLCVCTVLCA